MERSKKQTLADILVPSGVTWCLAYLNLNTMNSLSSLEMCVAESLMRGSKPGIKNERMFVLLPLSLRAMNKLSGVVVVRLKSRLQNVRGCESMSVSNWGESVSAVVTDAKNVVIAAGS